MKKYLIKVQPLTHLHIGSGREFEPINYIIDSYKAKTTDGKTVIRYALYEFDEMDFYANLDESAKDEFLNLASAIDENGVIEVESRTGIYPMSWYSKIIWEYIILIHSR